MAVQRSAALLAFGLALLGAAPVVAEDGNKGTTKVDGPTFDLRMDNEPHPGCAFRIVFHHFDEGQTGDVTIRAQAPSGSGVVSSRTGLPLDTPDEYTMDDLDLSGLTAHPKQGYHLKVTLTTDRPGGVKHKVFWLACPAAAPTGSPAATGTPTVLPTGTGSPSPTETPSPTVSGVATVSPSPSPTVSPTATVLGVRLSRAPAAPGAGPGAAVGGLAVTGSFAALLTAAGLALVVTGTVLAARRG